uniref:Uncharacterized protein n=1 Tax=Arion vulgaris TaxID=1028688 RepID=A0A0B6YAQ2_9EUPU
MCGFPRKDVQITKPWSQEEYVFSEHGSYSSNTSTKHLKEEFIPSGECSKSNTVLTSLVIYGSERNNTEQCLPLKYYNSSTEKKQCCQQLKILNLSIQQAYTRRSRYQIFQSRLYLQNQF